jgi:hypothetical protein
VATNLELKAMINEIKARLTEIESRMVSIPPKAEEPEQKMCPYCWVKPYHHLHVAACKKKNKNDGNRASGGA